MVLAPSLVSTSPPKPSSVMVSPTTGLAGLDEPLGFSDLAGFSLTASLTLVAALAVLGCFLGAGAGVVGGTSPAWSA